MVQCKEIEENKVEQGIRGMVECSRVKYSEVEPSRAMVVCNRVK